MEYKEDILGDGFMCRTIPLEDDYESHAVATLVKRPALHPSRRAVLYIHGFNDYFFQKEMALEFNRHGENFYALDLRKYGRSYLPHQKFNDIRDVKAYYEEITAALQIMKSEGNDSVILLGHSTGGLIITLYAKDHPGSDLFDALILNSPFFKFNLPAYQMVFLPVTVGLGRFFPKVRVSGGFSEKYGVAIHKGNGGEWDYDLAWKPHVAPKINFGWLRAIYKSQKEIRKPFQVDCPVLIMRSSASAGRHSSMEDIKSRDVILNVADIERAGRNIRGDVEFAVIDGGMHDLVLSRKPVREKVYATMTEWIDDCLGPLGLGF